VVGRDLLGIETKPRPHEEHINAAIEWVYQSQDVVSGGSAASYSLLTGWAGPYPETTGYIIPTLYDYGQYADSQEARTRAEQMARWLLGVQFEDGAFPEGVDPKAGADPSVFNTGQILLGLTRAYKETNDPAFRRAASDAADWLVAVQHPDGYWDEHDYRGERHVYCSRVAWSLLEASDVCPNGDYVDDAKSHLEWVLSKQSADGWFENAGFSPDEAPYLHTIAYTVRGLLESGLSLGDDRYVAAAETTAAKLNALRRSESSLKATYDCSWKGPDYRCLTGEAQMAIVWSRLASVRGEETYRQSVEATLDGLKRQQVIGGGSANISGGIKGSRPIWRRYMRFRYPNWAAKFFIDALLCAGNRETHET
jgi:hypothetical protein